MGRLVHTVASDPKPDKIPLSVMELFGAWEDDRSAEEIIDELYQGHTVSQKD
jgi:hypothetical protein